MSRYPDFRDPSWLRKHVLGILRFYYPDCIDEERGGYVNQFSDRTGEVYDPDPKHLVATCRHVFGFSVGALLDGPDWCLSAAEHGLEFLFESHYDDEHGGFFRELSGSDVVDATKYCYGHAFALLAVATAAQAGVPGAPERVENAADELERFFEAEHGLYRPEFERDWASFSTYRGQNPNMHACEALLAAHEATGEPEYLNRAEAIAATVSRELADRTDGLVWEHYTDQWEPDLEYNRNSPNALFRPWGYLTGHQLEWAKLLLVLDVFRGANWHRDRARSLFDRTVETAWDVTHGGLRYAFDPDGEVTDSEKYYWVMAEAIAAAALLAERTGAVAYWDWYDRIWEYTWDHLVNDDLGIWYRVLTAENDPYRPDVMDRDTRVKTDYHPVSACYTVRSHL